MNHTKRLLTIYWTMFKIGLFTYGGGYSIIAQIQTEFIENRKWLTEDQVADYMSLARSFPGIMIINMSVFCGYAMGGVPGAITAAFGLSSPAILVLSVITYFYAAFRENIYISRVMAGVRSAVVPILIMAAWKLKKNAMRGKSAPVILAVSFFLCTFTDFNKLILVIFALLAGLLIWRGEVEK